LERQAQRLAGDAVRAVGADEVAGAHGAGAAVALESRGDAVRVLLEAGDPHTPLDLYPVHGQLFAQNSLGGVLGDGREPERDVGPRANFHLADLLAVDEDELAEHLDRRIEDPVQYPHRLEDLKRTWLHANGFRIERRVV